MKIRELSFVLLATLVFASPAPADDLSYLLSELSFGDDVRPTAERAIAATGRKVASQPKLTATRGGFELPDFEPAPLVDQSARVLLQPPVAVLSRTDTVDLPSAFAVQEFEGTRSQSVGFSHQSDAHGYATGMGHQAATCPCDQGCDGMTQCIPRTPVQLPSSTLLQYFRSNPCNANVWNGYQQKCCPSHKHVHGQCDCFKERSKCGCLIDNACTSCDSACDR